MNATQESAIAKLKAQMEKQQERSAVWYAGYQLICICERDPAAAEILLPDLDNPEMDIVHAESQIHAFADKLHKENRRNGMTCVGVSDADGEMILRQFYGLPAAPDAPFPGLMAGDRFNGKFTGIISINPLDFLGDAQ